MLPNLISFLIWELQYAKFWLVTRENKDKRFAFVRMKISICIFKKEIPRFCIDVKIDVCAVNCENSSSCALEDIPHRICIIQLQYTSLILEIV